MGRRKERERDPLVLLSSPFPSPPAAAVCVTHEDNWGRVRGFIFLQKFKADDFLMIIKKRVF